MSSIVGERADPGVDEGEVRADLDGLHEGVGDGHERDRSRRDPHRALREAADLADLVAETIISTKSSRPGARLRIEHVHSPGPNGPGQDLGPAPLPHAYLVCMHTKDG
jgi:hypothetical protein